MDVAVKRLPLIRLRHKAAKIREDGHVSALCFEKPRAIDMTRASWVLLDGGVTCPKCLKIMESK
jgi:hypothetical protein